MIGGRERERGGERERGAEGDRMEGETKGGRGEGV